MIPEPGTSWRDIRAGTLIKVKGVTGAGAGATVDYEARTQAGWCRADAWERYFTPAEQRRKET